MRKITTHFLFLSACALAVSAYADTIYWTGGGANSGRGGTSPWVDVNNWSSGAVPSATDDVIFSQSHLAETNIKGALIGTSATATCANLTFEALYNDSSTTEIRMNSGAKLNVQGNMVVARTGYTQLFYDYAGANIPALNVVGNLVVGSSEHASKSTQSTLMLGLTRGEANSGWGPISCTVGGDVVLYDNSRLQNNTGVTKTVVDTANPGTYIGGLINMVAGSGVMSGSNPEFTVVNRSSGTDTLPTVGVVSSNGITGNGVFTNNSSVTATPSTGVLHLRNSASQNFVGWVLDGSNSKMMIIMDGAASQTFSGSRLSFTGGVEVRNGTVSFNGRYSDSGKTAADSHGTLTMLGGTFAINASSNVASSGTFGFDSLQYKSGSIKLNINDTAADTIKLLAGTITALEGMDGAVDFLLTGNLALLEEGYVKLVEWTEKTLLSAEDFSANSYNGKEALFDVRDDGLYVTYVIPEPAVYAAILGALALAIALRRRK